MFLLRMIISQPSLIPRTDLHRSVGGTMIFPYLTSTGRVPKVLCYGTRQNSWQKCRESETTERTLALPLSCSVPEDKSLNISELKMPLL